MSELRRGYNGTRILIEAGRILDPPFAAQGVYLTGAQIEMVRNITHYLNRRSTFVDEYHNDYYLMPGDEDWDDIQAIVADMEGKLMVLGNILWGFKEGFVYDLDYMAPAVGVATITVDEVAAGELLILQAISWVNTTGSRGIMQFLTKQGTTPCVLKLVVNGVVAQALSWQGRALLVAGDKIVVKQAGVDKSDSFTGSIWGYKMAVPE